MFWICGHYSLIAFIFTLWPFMENCASFFSEYYLIWGIYIFLAEDVYHRKLKPIFSERTFNAQLLKHTWTEEETVTPWGNDSVWTPSTVNLKNNNERNERIEVIELTHAKKELAFLEDSKGGQLNTQEWVERLQVWPLQTKL